MADTRERKVSEVMTKDAQCVAPHASVQAAAQMMRDFNIGLLPVCSFDRLIGVLTDRDIVVRAVADGRESGRTTVREVMSEQVFYCYEDHSVTEAARMMEERSVRRLLVLNRDLRLTGVLSVDDIAVAPGLAEAAGEVIDHAAEPHRHP